MTIRPLQDRILLKRVKSQAQTNSGLYIPESAQEKSQWAEVVATGPGRFYEESNSFQEVLVKRGDVVLLGKYAGTEIKIDGEEHIIVRQEDILGVRE